MCHPLFIIGNPRSGTSLFRLMLTNHKDICVPPECGYILWWYDKYKDWNFNQENVKSFIIDLSTSKKIETWKIDFNDLKKFVITNEPATYADLCLAVIEFYAIKNNQRGIFLGDKNNYYINHLAQLSEIFPSAYFLGLIRDGRDVACSYKAIRELKTSSPYKPKLSDHIETIAKEWVENNTQMADLFEKVDKARIFRYEDVISNPKSTLTDICSFLGVAFDQHMLDYYKDDSTKEPTATLDWKKKTLQAPDSDNIGKYSHILTPLEIERFENIAGNLLKANGYL
ncbi:sulfotransferase [Gangjinia marincola]